VECNVCDLEKKITSGKRVVVLFSGSGDLDSS
jgi:hypothetical protein